MYRAFLAVREGSMDVIAFSTKHSALPSQIYASKALEDMSYVLKAITSMRKIRRAEWCLVQRRRSLLL